jgi:N-acetylmuramoyl-L-alanine amidase
MKGIRPFLFAVCILLAAASPESAARTVVIDPGHGGHDRGGSPGQRIPEKPYALDIARRLAGALEARGFRTVMTRTGDYFVGLGERSAIGNSRGNLFVSIHLNSAPREGANGIETYYYTRKSAGLASAIHSRLVRAAGSENRGVRRRGFYVIRHTTRVPAVLCECGFLTNRAEARRLLTASHRQRLAEAIAAGIDAKY